MTKWEYCFITWIPLKGGMVQRAVCFCETSEAGARIVELGKPISEVEVLRTQLSKKNDWYAMAQLGQEGWELVAQENNPPWIGYLFKRPKE